MACVWKIDAGKMTTDDGRQMFHLNVANLTVNALVFGSCLVALGFVWWWFEKRRHNLLALHNLRSAVLLAAVLAGLAEIGHQWLTVHRLRQALAAVVCVAAPDVPHSQAEAEVPSMIGRTGELANGVDAGAGAVAWNTAVIGLAAASVGLGALVCLAVLVRVIERRDKCGLLWMALAAEGAQSIVRWCKFKYINDDDDGVIGTVPGRPTGGHGIVGRPEVCLALAAALAATTLAVVDGFTLYLEKNSGRRHVSSIMLSNERKLGYKTPHSPFLSKITFHWIVPLLWRGYRQPLELENLGALHEKDTSRYHYDQFLFIYQSYKTTRASLWWCYVRNSWRMFVVGGLLKLAGDLCALVGPLCISNIVDYIATQQRPPGDPVLAAAAAAMSASLILANDTAPMLTAGVVDKSNQSPATGDGGGRGADIGGQPEIPVSWSALLANGWIICCLVLVAAIAQGTLSQASTHLMDAEGIRLKNALQGLVYRKTLLLSSSCFHAGTASSTSANPQQSDKPRQSASHGPPSRTADAKGPPTGERVALEEVEVQHPTRCANSRNPKHTQTGPDASHHQQQDREVSRAKGPPRSADHDGPEIATSVVSCPGNASQPPPAECNGTTGTRQQQSAGSITDTGTVTNLMSDDAFNVMAFVKMVHYVWAIPLKIGFVMYLLYRQLGISTVIGSVVCIVTMTPLQILIGKLMAANAKQASECTDERLRRINEVLLGIKLIKLNAWEGVFRDKISLARRQELRHLDLDSIYWTLMMLLTHVSSVLITIVTIAVFLGLEHNPIELTAGRLFASLALFNQLTVPLFIFPITIPVTLSAVVSTARLEAFLGQPEVERGSLEGIRTMARILSRSNASLDLDETDGEAGSETEPLRGRTAPEAVADPGTNREEAVNVADNVESPQSPVESGRSLSQHSSVSSSSRSTRSNPCEDAEPVARRSGRCRPAKFKKTVASPRVKLKKGSQLSVSARLEKCRQKQKHLAREMRFGLPDDAAVFLQDARFRWSDAKSGCTSLHVEQLTVPKGKLTVIVGRSGSGKSSLLAALLKEINHLSGELIWNKYSTIAYVPQKPWLQNATIRENVLFGESYRPKRYERVLRACALQPDLDLMPAGDGTAIGERGLKLSGGQRQRIAIARALYSSANAVILDDPLSALDNEVAMYVFEHGIHRMLTRQKRTAVLVTQKLQLVHRADNIVVLDGGAISATGSPTEIENNYPHILREWNAIIAKEQQQRSNEATASPGRTARERWKLFKNVSRISFQRNHPPEENDFMEVSVGGPRTLYNPRAATTRSPFGSQFSAHDFPLPIEECHEPNVALRRHFSSRLRMELSPSGDLRRETVGCGPADRHQGVFRTHSLQAGTTGAADSRPQDPDQKPKAVRHISFPITGVPLHPGGSRYADVSGAHRAAEGTGNVGADPDVRREDSCEDLKRSVAIGFRIPEFLRRFSFRGRRFSNPTELGTVDGGTRGRKGSRKTSSLKNVPGERHRSIKRLLSTISRRSEDTEESSVDCGEGEVSNRLIYDDERKYGRIPTRTYWLYLRSCGLKTVATFFLSALAQQALKVYTDFWLQEWTERAPRTPAGATGTNTSDTDPAAAAAAPLPAQPMASDVQHHFHIYAILSAVCIVLAAISVPAGQRAGSNARRRLHRALIASVLQNSIHFFQSVPLGRIMNRLSVDVAVVDKKIAATSQKLLQFILLCLCAVLINSVVTPYFILLTIPICGIYYVVQKFYRASSRELQRIESITYSPVLAHFAETIEGVTTIRAFGQESRFMEVLFRRMEANNVAQVALNCSNRWLGIALDYLGAVIVFVAILTALITASLRPTSTSSSLIGLAINYAMLVPIYLNWVVKLFAEMEMYGGAVERIQSLIEPGGSERRRLKRPPPVVGGVTEPPGHRGTQPGDTTCKLKNHRSVPISWPLKGDIVYEGVTLRYENQKENIITNLSLTIPAGQRLGICGRTGSGKSSLALALFGALEVTAGRILIDDVDIVGLHTDELRSRLSIIPQEVMLFGGSVRENLDPRGHFSDLELWNCLELAQLKAIVKQLPNGLDTGISEERHYFSSGQRQLFCLARAILRGSVCLVLDEATSSLDTDTEQLVLRAAKKAFKGRTVITIAHRLHSLFDHDRVLVLEQGRIVEDGCPRVLANTAGSKFGAMLKAATTEDRQPRSIVEDDG
ncbi:ATP-binding cassette sub-family C member Sur [Anopheles bellator]|uniref:ATP-binding cassette sub-family C member Sur n=1 Tax=Anopheles bellator TaxID=139047 RepID=UPI0026470F92|nr:ATP-binding cassette sub-family C member Sur [Anopheles bellator]